MGHGGVRITVEAVFRVESEQSRDDPWKIKATALLRVYYILLYTLYLCTCAHNIIASPPRRRRILSLVGAATAPDG